jgi:hypothetical protein
MYLRIIPMNVLVQTCSCLSIGDMLTPFIKIIPQYQFVEGFSYHGLVLEAYYD